MLPSTVYCDNCGAVNRPQAQFCVACGQALASALSASRTQAARPWLPTEGAHKVDRVGQQLGNYRLIRLLGKGGFAEVYLGEHVYLETQAAIKVLLTQLASEDQEPFRLEAKRVAHLEHPHIVRVLEFGVDGTTPYLVMSYAPNGTLRERHPKGVALPLPTILGYVQQAADALQYAHDEHFVHRDVKPENLLIGRRQEVLLSDFGIALLTQTSRSQSMQDVAGTASYMAPEQFQGKPRPASDQYSLGIVVYEWLTGDRPFHGSFTEIASQHLFVPPPPLHERMLTISPAVEQVVLMALAKDPKQRFATIQAFATALEQASQAEASQTLPASRSLAPTDAMTQLRPLQPAAELTTLPSESAIPTELVTPPSQPAIPTVLSTPSSQTAVPIELVTPPSQATVLPTELATTASQSSSLPSAGVRQTEQRSSPTVLARPSKPVTALPDVMIPMKPTKPKPSISKGRIILFIGLALVLILGGAGVLYTRLNAAKVVQTANPYPPHSGNLILDDPLSNNNNGNQWIEYTDPKYACQFSNGTYHASLSYPGIYNCIAEATNFSNFAYQVQMTIIKGNCGGIVFRDHSAQGEFYFFLICQDGTYSLSLYTGSKFVPLIPSHSSSAVHVGLNSSNLIAVVANGEAITLYVNDRSIDSMNDSTFSQGEIGVLASVSDTPTEVVFSNVKLWTL